MEDKAFFRQSLEEDRGKLLEELNRDRTPKNADKTVERAVEKFKEGIKHPHDDTLENQEPSIDSSSDTSSSANPTNHSAPGSQQPTRPTSPPARNDRSELSFSERFRAKGSAMKIAYNKYKPVVMAHISNSLSGTQETPNTQSRSIPQQNSSPSSPPSAQSSPSTNSPSDAAETHLQNLGEGGLPTINIESQPGGSFNGTLNISHEVVRAYKPEGESIDNQVTGDHPRFLKLKAYHSGAKRATTTVDLIDPEGLSVISDIDDTIKQTDILSGPRTVLKKTFLEEMNDVPGMAGVYDVWWNNETAFHYVSNSPWPLIPSLLEFFKKRKFPPGSLHLRLTEGVLKTYFTAAGEHKKKTIRALLKDFPNRKFILIGDSGEIDMEM
jgi:hypothetical protein